MQFSAIEGPSDRFRLSLEVSYWIFCENRMRTLFSQNNLSNVGMRDAYTSLAQENVRLVQIVQRIVPPFR